MNLVEHYIKKVIKIEDVRDDFTLSNYLIVTMEVNCYGNTEIIKKLYSNIVELNKDLEKGYFMG